MTLISIPKNPIAPSVAKVDLYEDNVLKLPTSTIPLPPIICTRRSTGSGLLSPDTAQYRDRLFDVSPGPRVLAVELIPRVGVGGRDTDSIWDSAPSLIDPDGGARGRLVNSSPTSEPSSSNWDTLMC